jgi:hypothetical protein
MCISFEYCVWKHLDPACRFLLFEINGNGVMFYSCFKGDREGRFYTCFNQTTYNFSTTHSSQQVFYSLQLNQTDPNNHSLVLLFYFFSGPSVVSSCTIRVCSLCASTTHDLPLEPQPSLHTLVVNNLPSIPEVLIAHHYHHVFYRCSDYGTLSSSWIELPHHCDAYSPPPQPALLAAKESFQIWET